MITRRKTFKVTEEDNKRELVYEDILNDDNQIIASKDYQADQQTNGFNEYDQQGRVILERHMIDGEEAYRTEYAYDEEDEIIEMKQFVAGDLFEHMVQEIHEFGTIKRTFRYEEEIQRVVETDTDENSTALEFYEEEKLMEKHLKVYDPIARIELTRIFDPEGKVLAIREQRFDLSKNLIRFEEKDGEGNLLFLHENEYKGDTLISEQEQDYFENRYFKVLYEYDERNNMTGRKTYTLSDKLLEYQKNEYDEHDRLIRESGYAVGSFDAIYGTYVNNEQYLFEHEYILEEQKVMPF